MRSRLELHEELVNVFIKLGKWLWDPFDFNNDNVTEAIAREAPKHVYFQPPEKDQMRYPCILYDTERINIYHADDRPYYKMRSYRITIIDKNPDSELPRMIEEFPTVRYETHYTSDNLHHFVYKLYY